MSLNPVRSRDGAAFGLLLCFLAHIYVIPGEWLAGLAGWRLAVVSLTLATGLFILGRIGRREPFLWDGGRGLTLLAFCALTFISMRWSVYPEATRFTAMELLKWVILYMAIVNMVTTERHLALACAVLVLASLFPSHGVIEWHRAGVDLVEGYRSRWVGLYADPNRMAMSVGLVVPLALAFLARRQSPWLVRLACGAAGGMAIAAMVLSYSRGGFLGLMAAGVTWVVLERRLARTLLVAMAAVAMLVFSPQSFWTRTQSVSAFEQDASAMSRVEAWTVASRASLEHPVLGLGAGTFRYAWRLYGPEHGTGRAYAAHNIFLQVISDLGFLGLALFLAFIGAVLGPLVAASRDRERGWLARALAASTVGYLVSCLFAGFLVAVHFYVLFALSACAERLLRRREPKPGLPGMAPLSMLEQARERSA
jgi:putative inorganic carbon (HCO3(-)) transporter